MTMGQSIRNHRKKAKLTMKQLAEITGYSYNHIHRVETNAHMPGITTIIDIADALGVSIDELIGHEVRNVRNS